MKPQSDFWTRIHTVAAKLKIKAVTVRKWKERGYVPSHRHYKFLETAPKVGVALTLKELAKQQ